MPRISRAASISWRRISAMFASTSGRSMFGFRIDPRSPPVQVATSTSTPSWTYFAVDAAPLLDSSSGWAWTCSSLRSVRALVTRHNGPRPVRRTVDRPCRRPAQDRPGRTLRTSYDEPPAAGRPGCRGRRGGRAGLAAVGGAVPRQPAGGVAAADIRGDVADVGDGGDRGGAQPGRGGDMPGPGEGTGLRDRGRDDGHRAGRHAAPADRPGGRHHPAPRDRGRADRMHHTRLRTPSLNPAPLPAPTRRVW